MTQLAVVYHSGYDHAAKQAEAVRTGAAMWAGQKWKGKLAAGFANAASQNGDKLNTLIQLAVFARGHQTKAA